MTDAEGSDKQPDGYVVINHSSTPELFGKYMIAACSDCNRPAHQWTDNEDSATFWCERQDAEALAPPDSGCVILGIFA